MKNIIKADFSFSKQSQQFHGVVAKPLVTLPEMVKQVMAEAIRYSRPFPEDDDQRKGFIQGVEWGMGKILNQIQSEQFKRGKEAS